MWMDILHNVTSNEALMAALGGVLAWLAKTKFSVRKLRKSKAALEDHNQKLANFLMHDFRMFGQMNHIINEMFAATPADRFLMLSANNGVEDFNFCTVVFDRDATKQDEGGVRRYRNIALDQPYKQMLKKAEAQGPVHIHTEDLEDGLLKSIYELEGVTSATIMFLRRFPFNDGNDRIFYCSVATHAERGFSDNDRAIIKSYGGSLAQILTEWL